MESKRALDHSKTSHDDSIRTKSMRKITDLFCDFLSKAIMRQWFLDLLLSSYLQYKPGLDTD